MASLFRYYIPSLDLDDRSDDTESVVDDCVSFVSSLPGIGVSGGALVGVFHSVRLARARF